MKGWFVEPTERNEAVREERGGPVGGGRPGRRPGEETGAWEEFHFLTTKLR